MKAVRLAILGFGQRGMIYAAYAKQHAEEFVVTAITDTDPQKREIAAREYGCPVFDSYEKMLSFGVDADIIAVATQDGDHPEHAIACMKKGTTCCWKSRSQIRWRGVPKSKNPQRNTAER